MNELAKRTWLKWKEDREKRTTYRADEYGNDEFFFISGFEAAQQTFANTVTRFSAEGKERNENVARLG